MALDHAVQAVRSGRCEQAIVGAANLLLSPMQFTMLESFDFFSKNGKAKSFQEEADGCVLSEGVGAVIIKPLQKAVNDNDHIYAVIRGIGVAHNGKGMSFTSPTGKGMKAAMFQAYDGTGTDPGTVSYVEAHGTATPMGDAVEISALKSGYDEIAAAYPNGLRTESPCYISSLKPCTGHSLTASGMAGLIKVVMALKNKMIPGLPGFENLNKNISLKGTRFDISPENHNWKALAETDGKELPRRAAINSFGFSGVNAHAIIEEYLPDESVSQLISESGKSADKPQIFVLSAKNEEQLKVYAKNMADFLEKDGLSETVTDSYEQFLCENLETDLLISACDILKVKKDDISSETSLAEYGFDPVSLSEFGEQINEKYGLRINPGVFAEYPSISSFTEHLADEYKEDLIRFYPENLQEKGKKQSETRTGLADLAYTLQTGRREMEYRLAMVVSNNRDLVRGLGAYPGSGQDEKDPDSSVPVFTGNSKDDHSGIRNLLSGKLGETVVQTLLAENDLEKLALYWTRGGKIPWEPLHNGNSRRISLPTYPFEKQRCWIDTRSESEPGAEKERLPGSAADCAGIGHISRDRDVTDMVSRISGIPASELDPDRPLDQYGFDSVILMQLLQQLQTQTELPVTLETLKECKTIQDIVNILPQDTLNRPMLSEKQAGIAVALSQFPELIHLNQESEGRPVFWLHSGLGGVEMYQEIAGKSQRPFYGIQPRGWMTDRIPLHGVQAMASYYVHIIQSVQPAGPYSLGGFSFGGLLAYEVIRQLQELGQAADTIVMIDSLYSDEMKKIKPSLKSAILGQVNMALLSAVLHEPEKIFQRLIHREEVSPDQEDYLFMKQVTELAKTRGLAMTESRLQARVQQSMKVQQAYDLDNFSVLPLGDSQSVTCYYFRNKSGLFWGGLEPYFLFVNRPYQKRI